MPFQNSSSSLYNAKKKSLYEYTHEMITIFKSNPAGSDIYLLPLASAMGVARRRVYDVLNVLEGVQVVARGKAKKQFVIVGFSNINMTLARLKGLVQAGVLHLRDDQGEVE